jgi:hypothetical protein
VAIDVIKVYEEFIQANLLGVCMGKNLRDLEDRKGSGLILQDVVQSLWLCNPDFQRLYPFDANFPIFQY